jgi:hypothetical protein
VQLVSTGLATWRHPRSVQRDGRWFVTADADVRRVLPKGVARSTKFASDAEAVAYTLHEAHENLRELVWYEGQAAADALAAHCMEFPVPELCKCGLAPRHVLSSAGGGCRFRTIAGNRAIEVEAVQRMVTGLDGIRTLAYHLARQRRPATPRMVENAQIWPVLPDYIRERNTLAAARDGELWVEGARQLVTLSMQYAFEHTALVVDFQWSRHHRPAIVFDASFSNMAAYVADFARHLTDAGALRDEGHDRSVTCVACEQPYTPRTQPVPGSAYCKRPECQRERKRRNQAASRARRARERQERSSS